MKQFFCLLFALALLLCACGSSPDPTEAPTSAPTNGPTAAPTEPNPNEIYDDNGQLIEKLIFTGDVLTATERYEYTPDGQLSCTTLFDSEYHITSREAYRDGKVVKSWNFTWHEDGNVTVLDSDDEDGGILVKGTGMLLSSEVRDGGLFHIDNFDGRIITHDPRWNPVEERYTESDGNFILENCHTFTYDENDILCKEVHTVTGSVEAVYTYTYDVKGNMTQIITQEDGRTERHEYTHDDRGNALTWHFYVNDVLSESQTYTWHENGEMKSQTLYKGEAITEFVEFDENGFQSAHSWYEKGKLFCRGVNEEGSDLFRTVEFYDENGELRHIDTESITAYRFWVYDENGNKISGYGLDDGKIYEASYDDQGRILWEFDGAYGITDDTEYTYQPDGSYSDHHIGATFGSYQSEYDPLGRLKQRIFYSDGNVESEEYYAYNTAGLTAKKVFIEHYWSEDTEDWYSIQSEITYEYDAQGNCIKETLVEEDIRTVVHTYTYTKQDRRTEILWCIDGEEQGKKVLTFDEKGLLVAETDYGRSTTAYTYNDAGLLTKTTYADGSSTVNVYDANGRLIEEIDYESGITQKDRSQRFGLFAVCKINCCLRFWRGSAQASL